MTSGLNGLASMPATMGDAAWSTTETTPFFTNLSAADSAITSESSPLVKASNSWNNLLQSAQKLATTQEAVVGYIAGGWLFASGYAVWGVATATKGRGQSGGG